MLSPGLRKRWGKNYITNKTLFIPFSYNFCYLFFPWHFLFGPFVHRDPLSKVWIKKRDTLFWFVHLQRQTPMAMKNYNDQLTIDPNKNCAELLLNPPQASKKEGLKNYQKTSTLRKNRDFVLPQTTTTTPPPSTGHKRLPNVKTVTTHAGGFRSVPFL